MAQSGRLEAQVERSVDDQAGGADRAEREQPHRESEAVPVETEQVAQEGELLAPGQLA